MNSLAASTDGLNRRSIFLGWVGTLVASLTACSHIPVVPLVGEKEALEERIQTYRLRLEDLERNIPRDTRLEETPDRGIYKIASKHISRITQTPIYVDKNGILLTREVVVSTDGWGMLAFILEAKWLKDNDICTITQVDNTIVIQKKLH